jgi:hypothetical protein
MTHQTTQLRLTLDAESETDSRGLEKLIQQLRGKLLELDMQAVARITGGPTPAKAKAGGAITWGTLLLTHERVQAGLAAACQRGRHGGRPRALDSKKLEAVTAALNTGTSKAAVCRTFGIRRSTLNDSPTRASWRGYGA